MSRRPAQPDHATILKQLVKLESNKSCADCKRNKHPRWASWNLGVFICIRCSGIHRSMGVHISRVKSVDLDTWTEEQMASIQRWGNARANKYWEAKLAPGHVPNEAKIENFIRTKYDSKRWVMDGPMPDPRTLDDDDDVPLSVVQEKVRVERTAGLRNGGSIAPPRAPAIDLFGDAAVETPVRPSTTEPTTRVPAPKATAAPARSTRPSESLLGFDFLGGTQSAPPRPSSTSGMAPSASSGRADLKHSILSLYASAPKAAPPAAQPIVSTDPFGAFSSAPSTQQSSGSGALGDLGDAFGSMSFASPTSPPARTPAATSSTSTAPAPRQTSVLSGGSFFDTKPVLPPKPASPPAHTKAPSNGFADFGGFESTPSPAVSTKAPPAATSSMGDLFDLSTPAAPTPAPPKASNPPPISASQYTAAAAFNLTQAKPTTIAPVQTQTTAIPMASNFDAWGSSDAWATPDPSPAPAPAAAPPPQTSTTSYKTPAAAPVLTSSAGGWADTGGWGEAESTPAKQGISTPAATSSSGFTVQQDEEFGGWSHASPIATSGSTKPSGAAGNSDDLFGNVWG